MSSPTAAEIVTQLKGVVDILEEWRKFGEVNAKNFVSMEDTLVQSLEGDFSDQVLDGIASIRSTLAAGIAPPAVQAAIAPLLRDWARHIMSRPEITDPFAILDYMYRYFADNSLTIQTRAISFGSFAPGGSNVGNGTVLRVTTDARNYPIENVNVEAKTLLCVADQNTGTQKEEENFAALGSPPGRDALQVSGSGSTSTVAMASSRNSLLLNSSFDSFSGTASSPTDISSWTSSVTVNSTNYTFDSTNYYRTTPGVTTNYALNLKVTANLTQKLSLRGTRLDPTVPYMLQVAWNRQVGSASGTLLTRMGAQSNSVSVSAQTGWQILRTPTTFGQNNWYRNFDEDALDIAIEWTRTGGELLIDDVLFIPGQQFNGSWVFAVPNATGATAHVAFLRDDTFTVTDTATDSKIQKWLWRGFNAYLPSSGSPTYTDP